MDQATLPETGNFDEFRKQKREAAKAPKEPVEPKVEAKVEPKVEEPDDKVEDDEGLTAAERKAYSEKIARKISAKHRALKQAEAAIGVESKGRQAAEKLASELRAEIEVLKKGVPKDDGKGPKRDAFESDEAWWDAKIEWKAEQKAEEKYATLEKKREQEKLELAKQARVEAFASTVDDYDEMLEVLKGHAQHQAVIDYFLEADLGPHLIYYFGSHPDEYDKLAKMKPIAAVAEVGKIESRLERKAEKIDKIEKADDALEKLKSPISRAPAPITPIPEGVSPVKNDLTKINNFDEYRRAKRAQGL